MKQPVMKQIEWMTPDAFRSMYEATYKPASMALDQEMSAAITIEDNRSRLGMYTRRDSAEDVARKASERTPSEICVIEEPVGRVWSRFSEGRIMYVATPSPRQVDQRERVNRR